MSLSDDTYDRLFYDSDYRSFMDSSHGSYMDYESDESTVIEEEILSPMKELDKFCKSNELSIAELHKIKNNIPNTLKGEQLKAYHKHPFFHHACSMGM